MEILPVGSIVLLPKQDHFGDPDPQSGIWGETGCWGEVRSRPFDAVIGIGGETAEPWIAGKVTWGGLYRHHVGIHPDGYPMWSFDHFLHAGSKGPLVEPPHFPMLAARMQKAGRGAVSHIIGNTALCAELQRIIVFIFEFARPSASSTPKPKGGCPARR